MRRRYEFDQFFASHFLVVDYLTVLLCQLPPFTWFQELAFHEEEKARNKQVGCFLVWCLLLSDKRYIYTYVLKIPFEFSLYMQFCHSSLLKDGSFPEKSKISQPFFADTWHAISMKVNRRTVHQ